MTALQLCRRLAWDMLTGRIKPSWPVVREHGDWDENGLSRYKEIYFTDWHDRHRVPIQFPSNDPYVIGHQFYDRSSEDDQVTVVVLD